MQKKLYCSPDKKICGVCGGLADYFGIDPTFMRFIVAEIAFFTAIVPAFIVYLIMAVVIPQAPADYQRPIKEKYLTWSADKKISGVCGGIAEYFNIDATLVRLLFVVLFILFGNGLYTYIFGAIFMPQPMGVATPQDYNTYGYHDAAGYTDPSDTADPTDVPPRR